MTVKPKVNSQRLWDTLHHSCQWGCTPDGGMNRLTLNADDGKVRNWFVSEMESLGCVVTVDAMGNIFAVYPGQDESVAPIGMGSHLDTQPAGGRYDGILGVNAGIEVLRVIKENNIKTFAPIAIIDWTNEEGARFKRMTCASSVWAGRNTIEEMYALEDDDGAIFEQELERIGYKGKLECSHKAFPLSGHFELHIEQGPILEESELRVGVVQGIQSMRWFEVHVFGRESHAGTTPMDRRLDSLLVAAQMIVEVNKMSAEYNGVTTVGQIATKTKSPNTIAGEVFFTVDMRHVEDSVLETMCNELPKRLKALAGDQRLELRQTWQADAVKFDVDAIGHVRDEATELFGADKITDITSGAGHDSANTALHFPTAMVFVPCRGGISHNPAEFTNQEQCADGAATLLGAVLRFDEALRAKHSNKRQKVE